jgi:PAS domain S-box-containing protein
MEIKFTSQAFVALNKVTVHLQRAQKTLTRLGRSVIDKPRRLQGARRRSENALRKLLESSLDAIVAANGKIATFGSQAFIALNKVMAHLQRAQKTLTRLGRGAGDKLQDARRTRENDLRQLLENSLDAIVVANGKISTFGSQAFIALNEVTVHLQRAQKTLTRLGRSVIDKPRRLQEARRTSESALRKLLENSLDAIVVTDGDHRLVYANPKALDLFGVSELNMRKFTIDTFLSHCQILKLQRKWFAIRRDERYGKCKISRLDGSLRVAEYIFVANFTSRRDLYRFDHVAPPGVAQLRFSAKMPISNTESALGNQFGSSRPEKFPKSWLVN